LTRAQEGIARLNARHGEAPGGGDRFLLFHRRRLWNGVQGKWMGWERKRGKLHELNRLLRGATDTTFVPDEEMSPPPPGVRYVITLDADTQLGRGTAARLVGTMAHRLHRPILDRQQRRVVEGYAVLQPRVAPTMPTEGRGTPFQRIFSGPSGIDPYASAISDVYQDLFREGSYTGKGIYEVDTFEAALAGRVPENALLSHDLFEGSSPVPAWPPTSRCSRSSPRSTPWPRRASTGGPGATGSSSPGSSVAAFPSSDAGRCWTT
jgi:cyclic beta-1,2-glucan synthetase